MNGKADKGITETAARLRDEGTPHAVATVVRTIASTAAKPGMKAIILEDGAYAKGWLGGGCVTSAVRRAAQTAILTGEATLVCLRPEELLADAEDGEDMVMLARNGCPSKGSMDIFVEPVVPQPELLVFGTGPVARALLRIAGGFGFTLACCGDDIPDDGTVSHSFSRPEDVASHAGGNAERYVIVATQGAGDVASLTTALRMPNSYLAFVGSRKKFASYRERLLAAGIAASNIDLVRSPAGLHINAVTPEEIALSVMAEIVQTRRSARRAEAVNG